jgi:hypothetical protein
MGTRCPYCRVSEKGRGKYLCLGCWLALQAGTRRALSLRDSRARARLCELHTQIAAAVPLAEIEVGE